MVYRIRTRPPFDTVKAELLYEEGTTLYKIAEKLKITYGVLYYWLRKTGHKQHRRNNWYTPARKANRRRLDIRDNQIRMMQRAGDKLEYIGTVFNLTKQRVSMICRRL